MVLKNQRRPAITAFNSPYSKENEYNTPSLDVEFSIEDEKLDIWFKEYIEEKTINIDNGSK